MKHFSRGSLARRVLGVSFALLSLPLLVYFFFIFRADYQSKQRETVLRLKELGRSRASLLKSLTIFNFRALELVEEVFQFEQPIPRASANYWQETLEGIARVGGFDFISYYTITPDDRYICTLSSDKTKIGKDYTSYHYVQHAAVYDQLAFLAFGTSSYKRRFYVTKTIYSKKDHRRIGLLTVSTSVDELLQKLISQEHSLYPIQISLLTEDHIVFASSHPGLALHSLTHLTAEERQRIEAKQQFGEGRILDAAIKIRPLADINHGIEMEYDGVTSLAFLLPIHGTDLTLLLDAPKNEVFNQEYRSLFTVLMIFCIVFLISLIATLWMTRRMSKPLDSLCTVMERVSEGDLDSRYHEDNLGFEINTIGNIFNQTISRLLRNMEAVKNERIQKEIFEQELKIGYDIQTSILPKSWPDFPGIKLTARFIPAKEVGGDFYDIFAKGPPGSEELVVSVADAAGKGISACLYSLVVRSILRSNYVEQDDIREMMKKSNNLFLEDTASTGMFVTVLTTIFNPRTKTLTYSSCGHNPGLLMRESGEMEQLSTSGIAMGAIPMEEVEGKSLQLKSGDVILLYTDGVTEAHNQGEEFGYGRVEEELKKRKGKSVDQIADHLLAAIRSFTNNAASHDDITIIVMKVS
jgi:sigma-B regulation protein RsbU (phosphoserine phosphatase)